MNDLGEKIKMLRMSKNITQTVLASRLGITKSVVSAYENSIRYPSYDVLVKLANIFDVSTDYLLGRAKNKTIDISGLNENEVEGIILLINSLKKSHNMK